MDFSAALNISAESIEKPPLPPVGHYTWQVGKAIFGGNNEYDWVDFQMQAIEAGEDVDRDDLQKVGGLKMVKTRNRFMFGKSEDDESKAKNANALFYLRQFVEEHCGVNIAGMNLKQVIDAAAGHQCIGDLSHRPDKDDPSKVYAQLGRTAPLG